MRSRHFGLESGYVIPSRPSHAGAPPLTVPCAAGVEQDYHLSMCRISGGKIPRRLPRSDPHFNEMTFSAMVINK